MYRLIVYVSIGELILLRHMTNHVLCALHALRLSNLTKFLSCRNTNLTSIKRCTAQIYIDHCTIA